MIYGIGTDICDISRVEKAFERHGNRFPERVLGPNELKVFQARYEKVKARGIKYLATRFSAKEAFSKAIGMGITMPMTWRRCEILSKPSGQPYIQLHDELKEWFEERDLHASVSITDESSFAVTFVVVEAIE